MGIGEIDVVSDAGPLIHLSEIGCLSIFSIFRSVHIPNAIWVETVEKGRVPEHDILNLGNIRRHTLYVSEMANYIEKNGFNELHLGEKECFFLCRKEDLSILLTDDLAARDMAKYFNLIPVGSLGYK